MAFCSTFIFKRDSLACCWDEVVLLRRPAAPRHWSWANDTPAERCAHLVFTANDDFTCSCMSVFVCEKSMMQACIKPSFKLRLETTGELCDKRGLKRIWCTSRINVSIQGITELVKRCALDWLCDLQDGASLVRGLDSLDVVGMVWASLVTFQPQRPRTS